MSQQILGPNTLIQGALPDILAKTPQSYFENTVKVIKVSMIQCTSNKQSDSTFTSIEIYLKILPFEEAIPGVY